MSYNLKDLMCRGNITLEIVDDFALYKAELMSSIGNIFRNDDISTEITLSVYKGLENITHMFTDIEWKRFTFNSNGEEDREWGKKHHGKNRIEVTKEEIEGKAVIQCAVYQQIEGIRTLVAAQTITFIDINDMTPSATPPANPMDGEIWIDNTVDPPVIKVWDEKKGQWITITIASSSTKNLINNSNFFKGYSFLNFKLVGRLHDYRISPYQNKNYAQLRADFYDNEKRGFYQDLKVNYFPKETYLYQAKAYILDQTGMYDGGLTLEICDVTTKKGPNLEIIEEEKTIGKKSFKLRNDKVENIYFTFVMPEKITKLRAYVYGDPGSVFHIAVTELSLSNNNRLHEWQKSDDDLEWILNNKVENDPKEVFNALTDGGKMQGIYTAINPETQMDDYYINANYIKSGQVEADYINAKGLTVSKDIVQEDGTNKTVNTLEVTKDGDVHILANKLSIMPYAETNIPTKDEVDKELNTKVNADKESIIGAINDTGMFIENGKLSLNADNVSTGVLKSRNNVSVFNLNAGTFRLGNSDDYFKLKFDGENLLFGQGAIKWENLDNSVVEELTPYDAYLEKTSVIVTDEINQSSVTYSGNDIVIPDNKPTNRVLATKGNNKLTAVDSNPKQGEFSFRLLEQNGCTAVKYSPSEFYVDKVTQENAYVKVSISCEEKQILTRTMTITMSNVQGTVGPPGDPGPAGDMAIFIYRKSKERPEKPTGNNPEGWYDRIEEIMEQGDLWCSQGIKAADTGELKGEWQLPYRLEEMNNNLLSNYPWKPGAGEYGIYKPLGASNENMRAYDKDPKGNQSVVWIATSQDANGVMDFIDGGFTASVKIDPMKTYRFSVWVKVNDIHCYINMLADITSTNDLDGNAQPNPSFVNTTLPEKDKWFLLVGYVLGAGTPHVPSNSGIYDSSNGDRILINGKEYSLPVYKNKDDATKQTIRVFMAGGEQIGVNAKFFDPRIEIVDGEEQTLDSMLGKMSNMKWIYEWNGTKTEINGSSVLTPKLFTGAIDEVTGKHTGIAMGMNVIGDGQNGIVGYSKGDKTFHIKTDGSAVFGKEDKDHIEISSDGIATLPVVKGDRIQANKLVVKLLDSKGNVVLDKQGKEINTLEITDRGEVIMHPSKFEMLSGIIEGGGSGGEDGDSPDALIPQLEQLGFSFTASPPKFVIKASNIMTNSLTADKLDLYGLTIYRKDSYGSLTGTKTMEVTSNGEIKINASSFRIDTGYQESSFNDAVTSLAINDKVISAVADKIDLSGLVEFSDLRYENSKTVIHGGNIKAHSLSIDSLDSASTEDAIITLFDNCALDASYYMNQGRGTAIRLKWDNNNYYLVTTDSASVYLGGEQCFSMHRSGVNISGNIRVGVKKTGGGTGDFGEAASYRYVNNAYAMQYYHKRTDKEFSTYAITKDAGEDPSYSFFKRYKTNIKSLKQNASEKMNAIVKARSFSEERLEKNYDTYANEKEIELIKAIEGEPEKFMTNVGLETEMQSDCLETIINKLETVQQNYDLLLEKYNTLQIQLVNLMGGE